MPGQLKDVETSVDLKDDGLAREVSLRHAKLGPVLVSSITYFIASSHVRTRFCWRTFQDLLHADRVSLIDLPY